VTHSHTKSFNGITVRDIAMIIFINIICFIKILQMEFSYIYVYMYMHINMYLYIYIGTVTILKALRHILPQILR